MKKMAKQKKEENLTELMSGILGRLYLTDAMKSTLSIGKALKIQLKEKDEKAESPKKDRFIAIKDDYKRTVIQNKGDYFIIKTKIKWDEIERVNQIDFLSGKEARKNDTHKDK